MRNIRLANYGDNFMFLEGLDRVVEQLVNDVPMGQSLRLDFEGVYIISPSYMTRLLDAIMVQLKPKNIALENANTRIESTFNFAIHSIKLKNSDKKSNNSFQYVGEN